MRRLGRGELPPRGATKAMNKAMNTDHLAAESEPDFDRALVAPVGAAHETDWI